jgi:membrane fusion protein, copper/silver efflux system
MTNGDNKDVMTESTESEHQEPVAHEVPERPIDPAQEPKAEGDARPSKPHQSRFRHILSVWGPRVGVSVLLVLAFTVGLQFGSPEASESDAAGHESHGSETKATIWTCSMHPQIKLPEPGQCPICGMDLIPAGGGDDSDSSDTTISLSERAKTLAEVRTAPVRRADTSVEVKLLGRLEYDETRERTVTPWTAGRIDRLFVSNVGAGVDPGQVIAHLYSPEVYAAHQDLIQAKRQVSTLSSGIPSAQSAAKAAMDAARNRLMLLGVSDDDLDKMARADSPWRTVKIRSNYGGTVLELLVHQGAYVNAGTPLFRVADLSRLWVQLDAYENDLARIKLKQEVELRIETFPGELFKGKVSFVDPVVDPRMRTARVRVEVANKGGRLRPGMFAEAVLDAAETKSETLPLVIPATAPLFTGTRSVVYVEVPGKERPTYEAREIRLGPRAGDLYPVVSGLEEGESVVVRGAFRLDSDLQIRGGRSMMTMDDDVSRAAMAPIDVPEAFLQGMAPTLESYLGLHVALSKDDLDAARKAFGDIAKSATSFNPRGPEPARKFWKELGPALAQEALGGQKAEDIEAARRAFESVSRRMIQTVQRFGNPGKEAIRLSFCPMAAGSKGAFWLQRADSIENPYFGASMFTCGDVRETAEHGKRISPHALHGKKPAAKAPAGHNH